MYHIIRFRIYYYNHFVLTRAHIALAESSRRDPRAGWWRCMALEVAVEAVGFGRCEIRGDVYKNIR